MKLGKVIKRGRINKGLSRREACERGGFCRGSIQKWEDTKRLPSIQNIFKLSNVVDITPDELFNFLLRERVDRYIKCHKKAFNLYKKGTRHISFKNYEWIENARRCSFTYPETGRYLREKREAAGFYEEDVAIKMGCWFHEIRDIERGDMLVGLKEIFLFAEIYRISPVSIFNVLLTERVRQYLNYCKKTYENFRCEATEHNGKWKDL